MAGPIVCKDGPLVVPTRAEKFPAMLVACDGRFIGVQVDGSGNLRLMVDIGGAVVNAEIINQKQGGDAFLTMTPALPGAGVTSVSSEIAMTLVGPPIQNFEPVVITIFADQPFEVYIDESTTSGGTFRRTALVAAGVTNELRVIELSLHGRDFVKVVVKNIGAAAMTVLEVTHKTWEF